MSFSNRTEAQASGPREKLRLFAGGCPGQEDKLQRPSPQQHCLGLDPSTAPFWAPTLPALPLDNAAFQGQTKAGLKGENCVSMVEGRGGPPVGRAQQRKLCCIYARLTQHNLIFHIKDQIIFRLQLITQPKSPSKAPLHPPSPCSVAPHAPRFHGLLLGVRIPQLPIHRGRGTSSEAPKRAPISALAAWSPYQNSSSNIPRGSKPSCAPQALSPCAGRGNGVQPGQETNMSSWSLLWHSHWDESVGHTELTDFSV